MRKLKNTNQLADEILAPLSAFCAAKRGNMGIVIATFNKGLEKTVALQTMHSWLASDPAKRKPPAAGSLLRLFEAWREIRGRDVVNTAEPSIYCAVNGHRANNYGRCKKCDIPL